MRRLEGKIGKVVLGVFMLMEMGSLSPGQLNSRELPLEGLIEAILSGGSGLVR